MQAKKYTYYLVALIKTTNQLVDGTVVATNKASALDLFCSMQNIEKNVADYKIIVLRNGIL